MVLWASRVSDVANSLSIERLIIQMPSAHRRLAPGRPLNNSRRLSIPSLIAIGYTSRNGPRMGKQIRRRSDRQCRSRARRARDAEVVDAGSRATDAKAIAAIIALTHRQPDGNDAKRTLPNTAPAHT